jgi:hypothetical protein
MHRTFLGHLETGRKDFRLTSIIRVADALGITLQELFAGVEADTPFKPKRSKATGEPDYFGLKKEVAALERGVARLKAFISSEPRVRRPKASPKKPRPK